jgi:S-disulfanyl-L-cysteine oxidoreductase SoxD
MSRSIRTLALLAWVPAFAGMATAAQFPGVGRAATPAEIAAWDIDVRPDFKGLPPGSGSVAKGQQVWDAKCASCHGTFGESNEVFTPIVGGTTAADIATGRARSLATGGEARTTLMKLPTLSTLWDYVNRAMPWDKPKSLTVEEVYAAVAYILHLGDIVPADFVLSERNIAEVQARLPNRNGMSREHGLWDLRGKPDVANTACMRNCATEVRLASSMPDHARGSHGDLAEQNRVVGPVRGGLNGRAAEASQPPATAPSAQPASLARKAACLACHAAEKKLVGPAFREVAARYQGQPDAESRVAEKLRRGSSGAWGAVPMPANPELSERDARILAQWVLGGGR